MDFNATKDVLLENLASWRSWQIWSTLQPLLPSWTTIICTIVFVAVVTRLTSGKESSQRTNGARTVPQVPYWLPFLGHVPQFFFAPQTLLYWARSTYKDGGVFALNFGGTTHNIIFDPALGSALLNQKGAGADAEDVFKRIMRVVMGFPAAEMDKYDAALPEMVASYKHLMTEPALGKLVQGTADLLKSNVANLVSGAKSVVDQMAWERVSDVSIVTRADGEQVVDVEFLTLIKNFVALTASPSFTGPDLPANNPTLFPTLWAFDAGFLPLLTGLPRYVPIPSVTRAHIARRKLLSQLLLPYERAMSAHLSGHDPGISWSGLDDDDGVGALMAERARIYRRHGFSDDASAACDLALVWAMNANSNPLIFWLLVRVYADEALLARLREEVGPYVRPVRAGEEGLGLGGITELPRLEVLDHEGLERECVLLRSCYVECLRLHTASWSLKQLKQDLVLAARGRAKEGVVVLEKGSYAHVAHDLHHTDPAYFEEPEVWRADRHIRYRTDEGGNEVAEVHMGSIRAFGGGSSMCKGRAFAQKEVLMFAAAIIVLWDIEPRGGGPWTMPRKKKATGTYSTDDKVRVWIKRRPLPKDL